MTLQQPRSLSAVTCVLHILHSCLPIRAVICLFKVTTYVPRPLLPSVMLSTWTMITLMIDPREGSKSVSRLSLWMHGHSPLHAFILLFGILLSEQ